MSAKKPKPTSADPPTTPSPSDLPDGFRMVEVEPGKWIGLPTFDIKEWFDSCEIPLEERAGILERGGGYDGFQVSAALERETFQWLHDHGRPAVSSRTRWSDKTMAKAVRRFGRKQPGEREFLEHLERLDIRDDLQRQAEVEARGRSVAKKQDFVKLLNDYDAEFRRPKIADTGIGHILHVGHTCERLIVEVLQQFFRGDESEANTAASQGKLDELLSHVDEAVMSDEEQRVLDIAAGTPFGICGRTWTSGHNCLFDLARDFPSESSTLAPLLTANDVQRLLNQLAIERAKITSGAAGCAATSCVDSGNPRCSTPSRQAEFPGR